MTVRNLPSQLFALLSAVMIGLAIGAVWIVPTLYAARPLPWLALPVGWLLGKAIRRWVHPAGLFAAVLAALATLAAGIYVAFLTAAARIAALMGLGMIEAMRKSGTALLAQLTRMAWTPGDSAWLLLGMAVAVVYGLRPRRPATGG